MTSKKTDFDFEKFRAWKPTDAEQSSNRAISQLLAETAAAAVLLDRLKPPPEPDLAALIEREQQQAFEAGKQSGLDDPYTRRMAELQAEADYKARQQPATEAVDTAQAAPVVTAGNGPAKSRTKKPSIETVALSYMREIYKAGQYQSASKFHKHLCRTTDSENSPFEMGTGANARKLFCPDAGSFFDVGTLGKMWPKIRQSDSTS